MVLCTDEWGKNVSQHISGLKAVSGFAVQLYWDKIWPQAETPDNCHFAIQILSSMERRTGVCPPFLNSHFPSTLSTNPLSLLEEMHLWIPQETLMFLSRCVLLI